MKKRIIAIIVFIVLVISICIVIINNNKDKMVIDNKTIEFENNDNEIVEETLNPEEILFSEMSIVELIYDASNVESLIKESDVVAIVEFLSKEGTNISAESGERLSTVCTNGEMKIKKIYYNIAELKEGDVVKYQRPDGVIKFSEYIKGQTEAHIEKLIKNIEKCKGLTQEEMMNKYVLSYSYNNAQIEYGKEYLAYMKYFPESDTYIIIGYEYGLREVNEDKIFNNETKEYENLEDIVNKIK